MITLLLLSGGSQVAQFIAASLEGRRDGIRIVATNSIADDPELWAYDRVYLVPPTSKQPDAWRARVEDIIAREQPDMIIPCRDDDVEPLARLSENNPALHARSVCGPVPISRAFGDKWLSYELAREHGLAFAESCLVSEPPEVLRAFIARVGWPVIAKPRDGFSSKGIVLIDSEAQLLAMRERGNYVLQEYLGSPEQFAQFKSDLSRVGIPLFHTLHGEKHSIELMFSPDSTPHGVFATYNEQRFRARYVKPNTAPATMALGAECNRVFSQLGWRGPLNIQCQLDRHGVVKIHEFNGRYGALAAERALLGYDEVTLGIELFTGFKVPPSRWQQEPARWACAQMVSRAPIPSFVEALNRDGVWTRAGAG
jgi:carbamoylphosphate synthase large subunit